MHTTKRVPLFWLVPVLYCGAGSAHAIGLGDIKVHSGLGQPFRASVPLQSDKPLPADCIKLHTPNSLGLPTLPNLRYEVRETGGKPTQISLTTPQAAHEPALGVGITVQCEGLLQREYAVLLDIKPPSVPDPTPLSVAAAAVNSSPHSHLPSPAGESKPGSDTRTIRKPTVVPLADKTVGSSKPLTATAQKKESTTPQPRLTLSGTRLIKMDNELGVPLKLDLTLPDTTRIVERPLTESEQQDDNVALSHKLGHLEQQLAALQKRNEELSRQAALNATQSAKDAEPWFALPQWIYLLAGASLLSTLIAWLLYRRRQTCTRFAEEDDFIIVPPSAKAAETEIETLDIPTALLKTKSVADASTTDTGITPVPDQSQNVAAIESPEPLPSKDNDGLEFWADAYIANTEAELHDKLEDVVEVCLAHDNPDMAIQLLEQTIEENPADSPAPWLTLLDLLERTGKTERYDEIRGRFRLLFNINIPTPGQIQFAQSREGIESYPHVLAELQRLWQAGGAADYLQALLRDTRGGTRTGFDMETYREIALLRTMRQ